MATKGTAAKSASGASMSKYDVEVEARLQKLEAKVAKLEADSHPDRGGNGDPLDHDRIIELETKVNKLWN